jgi:(1->4)-alpha-D-glucan 1-alpha-D-glucosylmutase
LFQGTELWSYTLVDPDNRRPVDFALRQRLLAELQQRWGDVFGEHPHRQESNGNSTNGVGSSAAAENVPFLAELIEQRQDGRIKLFVTWRGLAVRREHWQTFIHGDYIPLRVAGAYAQHVVAVARHYQEQFVVAVVPRLTVGICGFGGPPPLADIWQDTVIELPAPLHGARLKNIITNDSVAGSAEGLLAGEVLRHFPVAILVS